MKKTMLGILMTVLILGLAQVASAAISGGFDVDVNVDDETVKPGESFTVEVDVKNLLSQDMEDIEVEITIKDLDEGDDLDDDDEIDDLDNGDSDDVEFEFDVSYAVKDDDYDIIITVSGEAANGTKYEDKVNATVEVEKEKHQLLMKEPVIDYETVKCTRTTEMSVTLWNIGQKDEDVELSVYNTELGINEKISFDIESGDDEDDIKSRRIFSLDLSEAKAKTYTFYVKADYDDGDEHETETFRIKVEDCETEKPVEEEPEEEVIVKETTPITTTPITAMPAVTVPAIVEEDTFMNQYGAALLLGLAYIVVIIIGILLVVSLLKKRH